MNRILEEELEFEIAEGYWVILHEIWREINEEYGYIPLMLLFHTEEFKDKWLKRVEMN